MRLGQSLTVVSLQGIRMDERLLDPGRVIRRRQATGPRSKKGCRTCRIRRVKCDETKPACYRCSSTGRGCEWFHGASPSATSSSTSSPAPCEDDWAIVRLTSANPKLSILPLPTGPLATAEERRSFEFFQQRTISQLSGPFVSEFWYTLLLQATHHDETIRHAVYALGAIHERFERCDPTVLRSNKDVVQGGFALQEYVKAINSLVGSATRAGREARPDVYLVASMLFAAFEVCVSLSSVQLLYGS
jgi:hypothetical protein